MSLTRAQWEKMWDAAARLDAIIQEMPPHSGSKSRAKKHVRFIKHLIQEVIGQMETESNPIIYAVFKDGSVVARDEPRKKSLKKLCDYWITVPRHQIFTGKEGRECGKPAQPGTRRCKSHKGR